MHVRSLAAGVVCAAGIFAVSATAALADTTVGPLAGNGNFTSNTRSASSSCPAGALVTGLQIGQETRGYIGSVSVICTAADGTVSTGATIGDSGIFPSTSSCSGQDVGRGIYGYTGNVLDGLGIRCGSVEGTPTNGPLVWDGSGGPQGPYDCPAGYALTGLTGTYANYFGEDVVVSLTGVCTEVVPGSKAECKDGGWMSFGSLFKNQGDCVSFVATKGKNPPTGSMP